MDTYWCGNEAYSSMESKVPRLRDETIADASVLNHVRITGDIV